MQTKIHQSLAKHIAPGDVELLEAAGVPEFPAQQPEHWSSPNGCAEDCPACAAENEVQLEKDYDKQLARIKSERAGKFTFAEMDNDKVVPTIRIFKNRPVVINGTTVSNKICVGRIDSRADAEALCAGANAAPDLLAACEIALQRIGDKNCQPVVESKLRAAIARARGGIAKI